MERHAARRRAGRRRQRVHRPDGRRRGSCRCARGARRTTSCPSTAASPARARRSGSRSTSPTATWSSSSTRTCISFDPHFVVGLLGPLLTDPTVGYVKGLYDRPLATTDGLVPTGGGRVTELTARPLLGALWPQLSGFVQPLSGEYAGRRRPARAGAVRLALRRRVRAADRPGRAGRHRRARAGRPRHPTALAPARRRAGAHGRADPADRAGPLPGRRGAERPAGPVRAHRTAASRR